MSPKSAKDVWEETRQVRPSRAQDGGLGHDELRDRWIERYPHIAHDDQRWMRYQAGAWEPIRERLVKQQILDVLEGSKGEGVKVTKGLLLSVLELADDTTYVPSDDWDSDPNLLVCANGTLEIDTREFREHRPEDYVTAKLPYKYDPEARCDVFLAVLRGAMQEEAEVEFLQEFAGYCLTPSSEHEKALWFVGPPGSGKSSVIEGFIAMLGAKHGLLGLAEIESSQFALARVPGKTLLTSTEQPASYLKSTHILDSLISGEPIAVERKHQDAIEINPTAKIIWAMNDPPRIGNTTSGIFRRIDVVPFPPLKKEKNPAIKEHIKSEGAGILNWALDGLARLEERGGFDPPSHIRAATSEFQSSNDLPRQFLEEEAEYDDQQEVAAKLLYNRYREWCLENGHKPMSSNRLASDWQRLGLDRRTLKGRKYWRGITLRGGPGA